MNIFFFQDKTISNLRIVQSDVRFPYYSFFSEFFVNVVTCDWLHTPKTAVDPQLTLTTALTESTTGSRRA